MRNYIASIHETLQQLAEGSGIAYGLAASDGVMACLEEKGIGFDTGFAVYWQGVVWR